MFCSTERYQSQEYDSFANYQKIRHLIYTPIEHYQQQLASKQLYTCIYSIPQSYFFKILLVKPFYLLPSRVSS